LSAPAGSRSARRTGRGRPRRRQPARWWRSGWRCAAARGCGAGPVQVAGRSSGAPQGDVAIGPTVCERGRAGRRADLGGRAGVVGVPVRRRVTALLSGPSQVYDGGDSPFRIPPLPPGGGTQAGRQGTAPLRGHWGGAVLGGSDAPSGHRGRWSGGRTSGCPPITTVCRQSDHLQCRHQK
jgi:hypothetical protein